MNNATGTLERTIAPLRRLVEDHRLKGAGVTVLARPLSPEEAIGTPGRRDFPIITGKERVVESRVLDARGHAFTDSPCEFEGTVDDVLDLELTTNQNRAIYLATLNAVLAHLNLVTATVHCRDDDPEQCAEEIAAGLHERFGEVRVGLIGLNPAIAERLASTFGPDKVLITDKDPANIGQHRFGVEVWDGNSRNEELIDASAVVLFTGTTLVNGSFDRIWRRLQATGTPYLVYGVTAAGVCELLGIDRICPRGRPGSDR